MYDMTCCAAVATETNPAMGTMSRMIDVTIRGRIRAVRTIKEGGQQ